jgi:hypothetical protein
MIHKYIAEECATAASSILLFRSWSRCAACARMRADQKGSPHAARTKPTGSPRNSAVSLFSPVSQAIREVVKQTNENHQIREVGDIPCTYFLSIPSSRHARLEKFSRSDARTMDGQHTRQLQGVDHRALASRFHFPALHPVGCPWTLVKLIGAFWRLLRPPHLL